LGAKGCNQRVDHLRQFAKSHFATLMQHVDESRLKVGREASPKAGHEVCGAPWVSASTQTKRQAVARTVKALRHNFAAACAAQAQPPENRRAMQRVLEARANHGTHDWLVRHTQRARMLDGGILGSQRDATRFFWFAHAANVTQKL
jgi:hypothetical protein